MSKLTFDNLNNLIPSMKSFDINKEHFQFTYAGHTIDCVLCFTENNYELLAAIHNLNYGFCVEIYQNRYGKYIAEIDDDIYKTFSKTLGLSYSKDGFTSNKLLTLLSSHIPNISKGVPVPYEKMRAYTKCRKIEESAKIYFCGWNDHTKDGETAHNFDKTCFYFGPKMADFCRKHNISSRWTYLEKDEVKYYNPSGYIS